MMDIFFQRNVPVVLSSHLCFCRGLSDLFRGEQPPFGLFTGHLESSTMKYWKKNQYKLINDSYVAMRNFNKSNQIY